MSRWLVTWEIDVSDAATPQEAATKALAVQRNHKSDAVVFGVTEVDDKLDAVGVTYNVDLQGVRSREHGC